MIDFFRKIFGRKNDQDEAVDYSLPSEFYESIQTETPNTEEEFVKQFIQNGGKLLICQNPNELIENLNNIHNENNWQNVFAFEQRGKKFLKKTNFKESPSSSKADANLFYCEFLIARTGKILISSNQIGEYPLSSYTNNHIFLANTSQLVIDLDEAMVKIKQRDQPIPSNIQPISSKNMFNSNQNNIYLLIADY